MTMPWEPERNIKSPSPHGLKEAQGHAMRGLHDPNCVVGRPIGPGLLSMSPINATPNDRGEPGRGPVKFEPSSRAPNDMGPGLLRANGPLNAAPHKYGGDPKEPNTYGLSRVPHGASHYLRDNERGDTPVHERSESRAERRREGE
jgi:hypothetical protein